MPRFCLGALVALGVSSLTPERACAQDVYQSNSNANTNTNPNTWRGVNGPNTTDVTGTQTPPGLPQIGGGGGALPPGWVPVLNQLPQWAQVPETINTGAGAVFSSMQEALLNWGNAVFQSTTTGNKEYAGLIYQRGDQTWGYTPAQQGDENTSRPELQLPAAMQDGANPLRIWSIHSHGSAQDPLFGLNSEKFSSHGPYFFLGGDMGKSARDGKTQFLLTPSGHIKQLVPLPFSNLTQARGTVYDLGSIFSPPLSPPTGI
jgi:hypothetical protein